MIVSSVRAKGFIKSMGAGQLLIENAPLEVTDARPQVVEHVFNAGPITVFPPIGARGVIITFPPDLVGQKILKKVFLDTGIIVADVGFTGSFYFPLFNETSFLMDNFVTETSPVKFQFF